MDEIAITVPDDSPNSPAMATNPLDELDDADRVFDV